MALPSSGTLTLDEVATEFGLTAPYTFPDDFYGLGGAPASGTLILPDDFYGRSAIDDTISGWTNSNIDASTTSFSNTVAGINTTVSLTFSASFSASYGTLTVSKNGSSQGTLTGLGNITFSVVNGDTVLVQWVNSNTGVAYTPIGNVTIQNTTASQSLGSFNIDAREDDGGLGN